MIRYLLLIIVTTICNGKILCQEGRCPKLPLEYVWEDAKDYKKDEELVKKTLRWLCNTPIGLDIVQRGRANAFVMEWLAGSPEILLDIDTKRLSFYETHPDLLFTFIHGMALYTIEKNGSADELSGYLKGYEAVGNLCIQSKELSNDHDLKRMLRAYKRNNLKQFYQNYCGFNKNK